MTRQLFVTFWLFGSISIACWTTSADSAEPSSRYQSLKCSVVASGGTWSIRDRDGANRLVPRYLSSLEWGETGTGKIVSPPFTVSTDTITFTIRGHDGQGGGKKLNFIALIDAKTGGALLKTMAPGMDPLQDRSWDVARWKGRKVYVEVRDGDSGSAFAWLGIGQIDAGPAMRVDFSKGMPPGWSISSPQTQQHSNVITGGVPFRRVRSAYTLVPSTGVATIPCGFTAERIFFLGCTVAQNKPLDIFGWIEIEYAQGARDRIPLVYGYTLDDDGKLLGKSNALHIHASTDPFQHYLSIRPRPDLIKSIVLRANGNENALPRITGITCQTDATAETLESLPDAQLSPAEETWIKSHTISSTAQKLMDVEPLIRQEHGIRAVHFQRSKISDQPYEAASVCDVDRDGSKDIVSGAYWYRGPQFSKRYDVAEVQPAGEYWCDFSDYPMDVNQDGYPDIVTGDFFGQPLRWLENPRSVRKQWKTHAIAEVGPIETTRFWDVDGDGTVEIVPNAGGNVVFFQLANDSRPDNQQRFTKHVVKMGGCGHGLGFGDVNGDGRGDFVVPNGWLESPPKPLTGQWTFHSDGLQMGTASVPILVHDVNADGKADLIVGQAHGYGLDWLEQEIDEQGNRTWTRHVVDRYYSQYHDMVLDDIDNDGELELITGKRYRAHNGHDPGSEDELFIRYFDIDHGIFTGHTIDLGPAKTTSGVGIYFWVEDLDSDGWKDLVCPGKEGLYIFKNLGFE